MDRMHVTHLILLCFWGGVFVTEAIMELCSQKDYTKRHIARIHFWIDLVVEAPLILGILITGIILTTRVWPLTTLHWLKISAGILPVIANITCIIIVIFRHHYSDNSHLLNRYSRFIIIFAILGTPFAIIAAYIGLVYFSA